MVNLMQRTCRLLQRNPPSGFLKVMRRLRRPESGILFIKRLDIFFFVYPELFTRVEFNLVYATIATRIKTFFNIPSRW